MTKKVKWSKKHLAELKALNEREQLLLDDAQQAVDTLMFTLTPNLMGLEDVHDTRDAVAEAEYELHQTATALEAVEDARVDLRLRAEKHGRCVMKRHEPKKKKVTAKKKGGKS